MMPKAPKNTKILSKNLFPVVGVGASAGGLEAFKQLVKAIHAKSGMAYILVQHLHPDYNSSLPEILQRETKIPVQEIIDNVTVKPNTIYIIPANKILVANDGILALSPRPYGKKNYAYRYLLFFACRSSPESCYRHYIIGHGRRRHGWAKKN